MPQRRPVSPIFTSSHPHHALWQLSNSNNQLHNFNAVHLKSSYNGFQHRTHGGTTRRIHLGTMQRTRPLLCKLCSARSRAWHGCGMSSLHRAAISQYQYGHRHFLLDHCSDINLVAYWILYMHKCSIWGSHYLDSIMYVFDVANLWLPIQIIQFFNYNQNNSYRKQLTKKLYTDNWTNFLS